MKMKKKKNNNNNKEESIEILKIIGLIKNI